LIYVPPIKVPGIASGASMTSGYGSIGVCRG
jgi:hypothetical protein